jgi:DNA polymerase family A/Toprim domain/CHC2 zinc finger
MPALFWDIETRSAASLEDAGAWRYAADATTEVLCIGFAVDDAEAQIWTPGQAIPAEFTTAANDPAWCIVAHNFAFERAIATRILCPRFDWPDIPVAQQRCSMSLALANALPAALDNAARALKLDNQKDQEGYLLMRRMARPRRPRKNEPPGIYWVDGPKLRERLHLYCKRDVETERALYHRLPSLAPFEQRLWELDAVINARGFYTDVALAKAACEIARIEQANINAEIRALTDGEIDSVHQVERIKAFVLKHGHTLASLTKRSVSAVLAHNPSDDVRQLLELRRAGARASTRKFDALLKSVDADQRLRGTLRFHASSTGRWAGSRFQPQNLKKPETKDLDAAVNAIMAGDMTWIRELGAPLTIAGDIARGIICAAPGHVLIGADFSAIESRVLAWLAGEEWKLETYRKYDATENPEFEPYCVMASQALKRTVTPNDEAGRAFGKVYDLAFGFGGGRGAWRKFDPTNTYSDGEVEEFKRAYRSTHRATAKLWHALEGAVHRCVCTGKRIELGNRFSFSVDNGTLFMTLPSGRRLAYPEAALAPGKFEFTRELRFKDNARGGWTDIGAWYGTLVENVVQATARDLLAAAMLRLEAAGYSIVLTVHDEIVCEVAKGFGTADEFHRLMTELPEWAAGLPVAAKVWTRQRYAKSKGKPTAQPITTAALQPPPIELDDASLILVEEDEEEAEIKVSLADLINEPIIGGKARCPFHDDTTPSLQIYADHYHCFVCGAHGDQVDWLVQVEGLNRDEAMRVLETWDGPPAPVTPNNPEVARASALRLWEAARPIAGTLAARYLSETRGIDLAALPANINAVLRFHARCPFGPGTRHPCLLALLRDVATDAITGIHRIALTADARKIERRMLGRTGAVKLWPAGAQLVVGEGIETVLAGATRFTHDDAPLQPAWSLVSSEALRRLPTIIGVERLIILVDHDDTGRMAASTCAARWTGAGRTVVELTPKPKGADFNDLVMPE